MGKNKLKTKHDPFYKLGLWKEKQSSQKTQQSNLRMSQQSLTAEGSIFPLTQVKKEFPYLGIVSPAEKLIRSLTRSTVWFDLFLSSQQRKGCFLTHNLGKAV